MFTGRLNCCVSLVHAPRFEVQVAPETQQLLMQRLKPPELLPSQNTGCVVPATDPPETVAPSVPVPFIVKFAELLLTKVIELPDAPPVTAVTMTVELLRTAVTRPPISRLIEVTILVASVVDVEFSTTLPVAVPAVTKVKVCEPI